MGRPFNKYESGQKLGNCIFLERCTKDSNKGLFICKCGKTFTSSITSVKKNKTVSCGCIRLKYNDEKYRTQGTMYRIYRHMLNRCYNPNVERYPNYGGRGITVCERWLDKEFGYKNFIDDMGERPSNKHSLDRIDVNGNYEPENCTWSTAKEQGRNTTRNRIIEYKGVKKCLCDWEIELGIKRTTILSRIDQRGWSVEAAFETPVRDRGR